MFFRFVKGRVNRLEILEGQSISRPVLSKRFKIFLGNPISPKAVWKVLPPKLTSQGYHPWVYGLDGKWLKKKGVIIIHRDITNKQNLLWSFWKSESYLAYDTDLKELVSLLGNNLPSGVISDWPGAVRSAVGKHLNNVPHQRCLAHVVREVEKLLPRKSSLSAIRFLRIIGQKLITVETEEERTAWISLLVFWHRHFDYLLKERTIGVNTKKKWWYTHGNLRRAWNLLTKNWQPFFVHLDYPIIPKSNNSLEGTISQIKAKLNNHRGMKLAHQVSFFFWYLIFSRVENSQDLKKLWGEWKRGKMGR